MTGAIFEHWSSETFIQANWPCINVLAGSTTRLGGFSENHWQGFNLGLHVGDNVQHVQKNRQLLQTKLNLPGSPVWLDQVHGTRVAEIINETGSCSPSGSYSCTHSTMEADASFTRLSNKVLAVMTADCLPIIFAVKKLDKSEAAECLTDSKWIAIAHCGWRSLAGGILKNLIETYKGNREYIFAWMGPAISQDYFQVGEDVYQAFVNGENNSLTSQSHCSRHARYARHFIEDGKGKWRADLIGLAREKLLELGVENIYFGTEKEVSSGCTFSEPERFFSYRREATTGRIVTIIYRKDEAKVNVTQEPEI